MIYVCCLEEMPRYVSALRPSHLVSVIAAGDMPRTPVSIPAERHLRLSCDDIIEPMPGFRPPEHAHVEELIAFARSWDRAAPMLIHCLAGVSRSTAAALTVCAVHAEGREADLARQLREVAPHANPNRRIIALADELLGCEGRLIAAVEAMGMPDFFIPATRPLVELTLD
ncbi:MAG: protein tyrosine phosphatase [Gammaproteobacteria bacterium]|nr:protein tyrosine phosphatase [Gammaproteobacteria bacterium]NIR61445.1 protein tyrosine phosphatase [Gammaproteobacteria bacterium]NIR91280.1 protein tyrosine phosphatase [Gammaproteobacteria bacterium]